MGRVGSCRVCWLREESGDMDKKPLLVGQLLLIGTKQMTGRGLLK